MNEKVVTITLDDYHRWMGELYVQVRELGAALQEAQRRLAAHEPPGEDPPA